MKEWWQWYGMGGGFAHSPEDFAQARCRECKVKLGDDHWSWCRAVQRLNALMTNREPSAMMLQGMQNAARRGEDK